MSCRKPCLPLLSASRLALLCARPGAKTQKRAEAMALLPPGLTLEDVVNEAEAQGDLAKMLIDKWCHGKLSAHALVSEARASVATNRGTVDELLLRLVNLNVHNAHRDLVQMLARRRAHAPSTTCSCTSRASRRHEWATPGAGGAMGMRAASASRYESQSPPTRAHWRRAA